MTGDQLRKRRLAAGLSQEELAAMVGVSRRTILRMENDYTEITKIMAEGIKAILRDRYGINGDWD